jgi:SP family arabinose:H+ symporter-like MFS transporter
MNWRSYFLSFELPLTQQLTGVNFIVTQVTQVTALYDQPLSHFTGLIANFIQFVSTAFSAYLLAKVGRRTIIVVGTISVGLLTIVIGIVFLELDKGWKAGFALGMALIMVFNVVYGLTLGPVVWLYVPEIAKKKIVPVATATYWGGCSFSLIVAPIITTIMHSPYAVFLFFGAYTSAMILPNYFLVE